MSYNVFSPQVLALNSLILNEIIYRSEILKFQFYDWQIYVFKDALHSVLMMK